MGKFLTGLLSFILGFVIGAVAIVGAVAGVAIYAVNTDLDILLETVGIDNVDDEGNYVYINTDSESGGVKNALELINKIQEAASDYQNLTLGKLEEVFPISGSLVNELCSKLSDYVEIDNQTLKSTSVSELGTFLKDTLMTVKLEKALTAAGVEQTLNETPLLQPLVYGIEADYVLTDAGQSPVYYDAYVKNVDGYQRLSDGVTLGLEYEQWLVADKNGETYSLYFYEYGEQWYVADSQFNATNTVYAEYSQGSASLSGDYYVDTNGVKSYYKTLGDLLQSGNILEVYDEVYIEDIFADNAEDNQIVIDLLGDVSIGSLLNGTVDFDNIINGAEISLLLDETSVNEPILVYLAYGVTQVSYNGATDTYTGLYTLGEGGDVNCIIQVDDNGNVTGVTDGNGNEIVGTTVGEVEKVISGVMDALTISDILGVEPDNSLMAFIGYNISGLTYEEGTVNGASYTYKGLYELDGGSLVTCYVQTQEKDGKTVISRAWYYDGEEENEISSLTISEVPDIISDVKITTFLTPEGDDAIMMYICYGVTDITPSTAAGCDYVGKIEINGAQIECYIAVNERNEVVSVYYLSNGNNVPVSGATVTGDELNNRLSGITEDLALTDVMPIEVSPENGAIMAFIGFSITDVQDNPAYNPNVTYASNSGYYRYVALYHNPDYDSDDTYQPEAVYVSVNEKGEIQSVVLQQALTSVEKTKISDVSKQVDRLTTTLKVKDLIEIDGDDRIMKKLGEYAINDIGSAIDDFIVSDFVEVNGESSVMMYAAYSISDVELIIPLDTPEEGKTYVFKGVYKNPKTNEESTVYYVTLYKKDDSGAYIYAVQNFYSDKDLTVEMPVITSNEVRPDGDYIIGTGINGINTKLEEIGNNLTIGDLIDITDDHTFLYKLKDSKLNDLNYDIEHKLTLCDFLDQVNPEDTLLTYLVYGVRHVEALSGTVTFNGEQMNYSYTGIYVDLNDREDICYLVVNGNGYIEAVYYDENGTILKDEGTKIGEVTERISGVTKNLTISELMDVEGNTILKKLGDSTVENLPEAINNLALQEISADSIYGNGEVGSAVLKKAVATVSDSATEIKFDAKYLYYGKDGKLVNGNGKLNELPNDGEYYTYGEAVGTWKFMLYSKDGAEAAYKITDLSDIMTNATSNIKTATLDDLAKAGIVEMSDEQLNKTLYTKRLGDYTLDSIIELIINLAQ